MLGRRHLMLGTLLLALFAGCATKGQTDTSDQLAAAAQQVDVHATATTGVIRGVVVDSAIRPIAGVLLSMTASGKAMATNSSSTGAFGFQGLAEGTYFVKAHKLGYLDIQTSVEVKAGIDEPALVKVALTADKTFVKPFFVVVSAKGFIQCGTDVVALCSVPNNACLPLIVFQPCLAHGPNVTNDGFSSYFAVDGVPSWLQGELVWDSTQALGNTLHVETRVSTPDNYKEGFYIRGMNSTDGTSPLLFIDDAAMVSDAKNQGKNALGNGTGLELDIFSGGNVMGFGGAQINQDYKIIAHLFYGYRPAPGWRFSTDGDPPVPS